MCEEDAWEVAIAVVISVYDRSKLGGKGPSVISSADAGVDHFNPRDTGPTCTDQADSTQF